MFTSSVTTLLSTGALKAPSYVNTKSKPYCTTHRVQGGAAICSTPSALAGTHLSVFITLAPRDESLPLFLVSFKPNFLLHH